MSDRQAYLEMKNISKGFPGVQALKDVSFDLYRGEIHALVGENGAGKSTLMKVLGGIYQQDEGEIFIDGRLVTLDTPRDAQDAGVSIVHQELSLFSNLTVMENVFSANMPRRGIIGLEDRRMAARATSELLEKFEFYLDPRTLLEDLSVGQQQVVEICRGLVQNATVLVLDEPTASLSEHESALLFKTLGQLRADGIAIIYISHRLEEVFEISDRITVLRDGQLVATEPTNETTINRIIQRMVGREILLSEFYGAKESIALHTVLEARNLTAAGRFEDVSFVLNAGEILGFAGLVGSGRTDVALACFGAISTQSGDILLEGLPVEITSPNKALQLGVAYLPEDRKEDGMFFDLSVRENISVTHLEELSRFGIVQRPREVAEAERYRAEMRIQTPSIEQEVLNLSGGNQQKVILSRWLAIHPKVLMVDEPTKGIDVGSKQEIYVLLRELAESGVGIIVISSEMPEVIGLSDRIMVMREGRVMGTIGGDDITEENVMTLAAGQAMAVREELILA